MSLPNELEYLPHTSRSDIASKKVLGLTLDKAQILAPKKRRSHSNTRGGNVALLSVRVFSDGRALFFDPAITMEEMFERVISAIRSAFETRSIVYMYLDPTVEKLCAYHITFRWLRMLSQAIQLEAWLLKLISYRRFSVREIESVWACRNTTGWNRNNDIKIIPRYEKNRRAFKDPSIINTLGSNVLRVLTQRPGWRYNITEPDRRYLLDLERLTMNARYNEDFLRIVPNPFNPGPAYTWLRAFPRLTSGILPSGDANTWTDVDHRHDSLYDLTSSTRELDRAGDSHSINGKRKRDALDSSDDDDGAMDAEDAMQGVQKGGQSSHNDNWEL